VRATGIDEAILKYVGKVVSSYPPDFNVHNTLTRIIKI
jgi:predicted trehalose synthase